MTDHEALSPDPKPPVEELLADEVASVAVDDPERAAQLVAAVAPNKPESSTASASASSQAGAAELVDPFASGGDSITERALPAAVVAVLVLQVLAKGRLKRLVLAALGSGLLYGMLSRQQQGR